MAELGGELKEIILDSTTPDRVTRVGSDLPEEFKRQLQSFLIEKQDIFTWTHEDMLEKDP